MFPLLKNTKERKKKDRRDAFHLTYGDCARSTSGSQTQRSYRSDNRLFPRRGPIFGAKFVTLDVVRDTHAHLTLGLNFGIARWLAAFRTRFLDKIRSLETQNVSYFSLFAI